MFRRVSKFDSQRSPIAKDARRKPRNRLRVEKWLRAAVIVIVPRGVAASGDQRQRYRWLGAGPVARAPAAAATRRVDHLEAARVGLVGVDAVADDDTAVLAAAAVVRGIV